MELVKYSGFVYEILTLLAWMTHTDLKSSAFPNAPQKRPDRGCYGNEGLFPYPPGENRTQAHTSGTASNNSFLLLPVFRISPFWGTISKVLFFVYAA